MYTKILFTAAALAASTFTFGQTEGSSKKMTYGFMLGSNYSNTIINDDLPYGTTSSGGVGFELGLTGDLSLGKGFFWSPSTRLAFNDATITFDNNDHTQSVYEVMKLALNVDAPFALQIGKGAWKPLLLAGPTVSIPLDQNDRPTDEFPTATSYGVQVGIGGFKKLPHFAIAPALVYSYGVNNVNQNPRLTDIQFHQLSLQVRITG